MLIIAIMAASCGSSKKEDESTLNDKKAELAKLKGEQKKLAGDIATLEAEIAKLDPSANTGTAKLVTVMPLAKQEFTHYIELQGKVGTDNVSYVMPRGMGGQVKAVYVKRGDYVRKGQLLLKLDDAIVRSQMAQLQSQLAYARDMYQRQQTLWKEDIGTEVAVVSARNQVTSLEKQMATLNEQLSFSNVYASVSGVADEVNIRVGETFTGSPMMGIKIVNTSDLRISASIPENYISRVRRGMPVEVVVPDLNNRIINTNVSLISQSIDPVTRGFLVEAPLKYDAALKPNQVATMKILDYKAANAIVIPVNVVQTDEKGKYVYIMVTENGRHIARKRSILVGESYGDGIEVKSGLTGGEQLVTEGYQNLYEGQLLATASR